MFRRVLRSRKPNYDAPLFSVLVVSDDPVTCSIIGETLNDHGYEVHVASTIVDALEILKQIQPPNLLIGDFRHPRVDGVQFLNRVRARLGKSGVPHILFLVDTKDDEIAARTIGAQELLCKPIEQTTLVTCVDKLIASRQAALTR